MVADNIVVLHHVHTQQVIMDQPQHHVTCEPSRRFCQLRNLIARSHVQFLPGVQLCAEVRVFLRGGRKVLITEQKLDRGMNKLT